MVKVVHQRPCKVKRALYFGKKGGVYSDFVNLKKICQLSFSKVFIGIGYVCVNKDKCMCTRMNTYVCTVLKKDITTLVLLDENMCVDHQDHHACIHDRKKSPRRP